MGRSQSERRMKRERYYKSILVDNVYHYRTAEKYANYRKNKRSVSLQVKNDKRIGRNKDLIK